MNILFLSTHLNFGGITNYLFNLANGVKEKGHTVFVASSGGELSGNFEKAGIKTIYLNIRTKQEIGFKTAAAIFSLRRIIKENKIDIIHSNSRVTQVVAELSARLSGIKHITTYHGFFKNKFTRRLFPCMGDKVIAISIPVKNYLVNDLEVNPEKVELIYNGIDTHFFSKAFSLEDRKNIKNDLGLGQDSSVIGIIARLSTVKGHPDFLIGFAEAFKERKDIEGLIIGEGPIENQLIALAKELGVNETVHFRDSVSDTRPALAIIDIFVMPSLMEGFGLAILEAMAMGKAVIATEIGGIKDIIENGKNGILVKPHNPHEIASAVLKLLRDEKLRKALGESARLTAAQKFPIEKTIEKTIQLYERIKN